ncbi:uncharacterized protein LOC120169450 [Hibiscus syriacus]|uniref:uncharacterized protein LOC120169450 n=1 Tax=Hibiscus syriacus TaxID=106335 RepID=UPI001923F65E|nr:uncharacterized protein LOC120169450 [Hibiscus syriacus]
MTKKQRIPKRGPGVAELEKILREQEEQKDGHLGEGNGINGGISSSSSSLPVTAIHGDGSGSSQLNVGAANGPSKVVYIGGSGVFLPEQALLPISWGSSSELTRKREEAPKMAAGFTFPVLASNRSPPPPMLQNHHHPFMVLFPQSATTKTQSSSPGEYRHVEPPSNQKPSPRNFISSLFGEEYMMTGTKRPRPSFPVENWRPRPTPMPFQPVRPQVPRLDLSSSSSNNDFFNFGTSRDKNPLSTIPLELKVKTFDHGNSSGNSSRSTTTENSQPDLSKFIKKLPFQENTEGSLPQKTSSSSGSEVSVHNKGSFSFLLQQEEVQRGTTSTEKSCTEETGDFIDLNLKL